MVEALPAKQRLALTWALDQWPSWTTDSPLMSRPELIESLSSGISNHSFLVQSDTQQFAIRLGGENIAALNLSREQEWQALSIAWQHKLAPRPIYQNTKQGVFVSEYIPQPPSSAGANIEKIAELLLKIHQLPALAFELDIIKQATAYKELALLKQPNNKLHIENIWQLFLPLAENAAALCTKKVFCHNDLLQANRLLFKDQLIGIDWEYAAMADPFFDMAAIVEGDQLSEAEVNQLFDIYTRQNPLDKAEKRLSLNRELYRHIDLLWHLATGIHPTAYKYDDILGK